MITELIYLFCIKKTEIIIMTILIRYQVDCLWHDFNLLIILFISNNLFKGFVPIGPLKFPNDNFEKL